MSNLVKTACLKTPEIDSFCSLLFCQSHSIPKFFSLFQSLEIFLTIEVFIFCIYLLL